ncbi:MAG: AMIN domain-containing protein, partial [Gemmatimonadota bacterium]|nr:AMIN domain-containing protein [Gemmatimonadota bacterium]
MKGLYRVMLVAAAVWATVTPLRADEPAGGEVTAVSLAPAAGKTEIVIAVSGAVEVRDFLLAAPDRLVLDVVGARLGGTTASLYDGVKRGGVLNLRYSQFRPDIVRVVIDLEGPAAYKVDRSGESIRVSFGAGQSFQAWSSTGESAPAPLAVELPDAAAAEPVVAEPAAPAQRRMPARPPEVGIRSAAM